MTQKQSADDADVADTMKKRSISSSDLAQFTIPVRVVRLCRLRNLRTNISRLAVLSSGGHHSYLSATIGSTLVALRAGTKQAPRTTAVSSIAVATYVIVSVGVT